jgi:hypothetical protein
MEGVSIVPTETLQALIFEIQDLKMTVMSTIAELQESKSPYMNSRQVMEITSNGKTWLNDNKDLIGFSKKNGRLRFKRSDVIEFIESGYHKKRKS